MKLTWGKINLSALCTLLVKIKVFLQIKGLFLTGRRGTLVIAWISRKELNK